MLISIDGTRFAFEKAEVLLLTSMMANVDDHPNLAALWMHPAKAQAWATDGHRAVLAERSAKPTKAAANARAVAITAATAALAAGAADAEDWISIDISGQTVVIDILVPKPSKRKITTIKGLVSRSKTRHSITCPRHAGNMNSMECMFPTATRRGLGLRPGEAVAVNGWLLDSAPLLANVAESGTMVWINLGGSLDPILLIASGRFSTAWRVVVMPISSKGVPPVYSGQPDKAPKQPAKGGGKSAKAA